MYPAKAPMKNGTKSPERAENRGRSFIVAYHIRLWHIVFQRIKI